MPTEVLVIGFGAAAEQIHSPSYARTGCFQVLGVVDPTPARRAAARRVFPHAEVYASTQQAIREMGGHRMLVDVCTPPALHRDGIEAALSMSWDCLSEKPLTMPSDTPSDLVQSFRELGATLWVVDEWRHAPAVRRARDLVGQGVIGEPLRASMECLRTRPARGTSEWLPDWRQNAHWSGGGILVDYGWHLFYTLRDIVGHEDDVRDLECVSVVPAGWEVEAEARVTYLAGTCHLTLSMSWRAPIRRTSVRVHGSRGTLAFDENRLQMHDFDGRLVIDEHTDTVLASKDAQSLWFDQTLLQLAHGFGDPRASSVAQKTALWTWQMVGRALERARSFPHPDVLNLDPE